MQTLDLTGDGQQPFPDFVWELDLTCPYCKGEGELDPCQGCGDKWSGGIVSCADGCDKETEYCEHCTEGHFEIMWNTAYGVRLRYGWTFDAAHLLAWDMGFCLVEHEGDHWLLMGMCGQDCTWMIHYTRWAIQGWLDREDIDSCLGSGGHVFLQGPERRELCDYFLTAIPTPKQYTESYAYTVGKIEEIRGKED